MIPTPSRRLRMSRPALDILESLNLVSVLPTLAAAPRLDGCTNGGVIFFEAARTDRPTPATLGFPSPSRHTNGPISTAPVPANPLKPAGEGAAGASSSSAKSNPSSGPTLSFATATDSGSPPESDLFDSSSTDDIDHPGLNPTPAPAAQARSSPAGAISHGPTTIANTGVPTSAAPATPKPPAAATSTAGATTALTAAVGQSLGDGIRPMTMPAATAGPSRSVGGRESASVQPDMGSGGGPVLPPILTSSTFAIQAVDPLQNTGQYVAYNYNDIPIGASCGLTAKSPNNANPIVSWDWGGGSAYGTYLSLPATNPAQVSQAAPSPPATNQGSYGFIVTPPAEGNIYTVNVTVDYQDGTWSDASLTFGTTTPDASLAVKQPGSEKVDTSGWVEVDPENPIQISATASVDQYTQGNFMFMQVLNSETSTFTDSNGNSMYIANTPAFPAFNGPLVDVPDGIEAYWYDYGGIGIHNGWKLPDFNGNMTMPAGGVRGALHVRCTGDTRPSPRHRRDLAHHR